MRIRDVAAPGRLLTPARGVALLVTGILVLALNLRSAITSLPPVFPELQSALHISASGLALLAAIPVLCFGVFSGAAAPLSRRFGEERVLGGALLLLAAGLLLRGISPTAAAVSRHRRGRGRHRADECAAAQPGQATDAGASWAADRAVPADAGGGAIVASLLAIPVFNAAGGSARGASTAGSAAVRITLALWAGPALLAALIWVPQLRYRTLPEGSGPAGRPAAGRRRGALAMGRSALAWQVTLFMGLQSLSYYATLSWFPTMFRERGVSAAHAGDLLALMNLGNAVTALILPMLAQRAADQRQLAAWSMLATVAGLAGAVFGPPAWPLASWSCSASARAPRSASASSTRWLARPSRSRAASLSAFAQGVGYLIASAGPLTIGFLHDATGGWTVPGSCCSRSRCCS